MNKEIYKKIKQYLIFGMVFPEKPSFPFDASVIRTEKFTPGNYLFKMAAEHMDAAFERCLHSVPHATHHLVPLSGGLDSRLILGWLLENFDRSKITVVTHGMRNTLDFEIARAVAKKARVRHILIDIGKISINTQDVVHTACKCSNWAFLLAAHANFMLYSFADSNTAVWSGFLGGESAGLHYQGHMECQAALDLFYTIQRRTSLYSDCHPQDIANVPLNSICISGLNNFDVLDFSLRQEYFIKPSLIPKDQHILTPYATPEWIGFILNIEDSLRSNKAFFDQFVDWRYPKLFAFPAKDRVTGKRIPRRKGVKYFAIRTKILSQRISAKFVRFFRLSHIIPHPRQNYWRFSGDLSRNKNIGKFVLENVSDLKKRQIIRDLNISAMVKSNRQHGKFAAELLYLSQLECYLKSEGKM